MVRGSRGSGSLSHDDRMTHPLAEAEADDSGEDDSKFRPQISKDVRERVDELAGEIMTVPPEAVGFSRRLGVILDQIDRQR